jgi:hypothetical protein
VKLQRVFGLLSMAMQTIGNGLFSDRRDLALSAPSRQTEAPGTEELAAIKNRNDYGQLG